MKKLSTLFVAFAMVSLSASAQEVNFKSKRGEYMLPEKGDWALGFNADGIFKYVGNAFNGNNGAPNVTYLNSGYDADNNTGLNPAMYGGQFVGKKFITDKKAWRVVANFKVGSEKTTTAENASNSVSEYKIALGLGKEWRRGKTRLQGFYGVDGLVGVHGRSTKNVNGSTTTKTREGLGFDLIGRGFIGCEYFIFPKIAFGAQYSWGLDLAVTTKGKSSVNGNSVNTYPTKTGFNLGGVSVASMSVFCHF